MFSDFYPGFLFNSNRHADYMSLMRSGKVGLYSTRGLSEKMANGYNQVTPRFLELLASGCHVILRYPDNEDTEFYDLARFGPCCDSYPLFESLMDRYRAEPVDLTAYSEYLERHYTSNRVKQFQAYLASM